MLVSSFHRVVQNLKGHWAQHSFSRFSGNTDVFENSSKRRRAGWVFGKSFKPVLQRTTRSLKRATLIACRRVRYFGLFSASYFLCFLGLLPFLTEHCIYHHCVSFVQDPHQQGREHASWRVAGTERWSFSTKIENFQVRILFTSEDWNFKVFAGFHLVYGKDFQGSFGEKKLLGTARNLQWCFKVSWSNSWLNEVGLLILLQQWIIDTLMIPKSKVR